VIHGQGGVAAGSTAGTSASQAQAGTSRLAQANTSGSAGTLPETGSDDYAGLLAGGGAMLLAGSGLLIYRRRFGAAG
jgi:LPXTG-motif cell wall-anchored protein